MKWLRQVLGLDWADFAPVQSVESPWDDDDVETLGHEDYPYPKAQSQVPAAMQGRR